MACSNCTTGLFVNADPTNQWISAGTVTTPNGTVIAVNSSGITVTKGSSILNFTRPLSGAIHFMNWGTPRNFVAILTVQSGSGSRTVSLVNTQGTTLTSIVITNISAASTVPLPFINFCPGDGSVALIGASNGSTIGASLVLSDSGTVLDSVVPFSATMQIIAEVTATQINILHGGTIIGSAVKPQPNCNVMPFPVTFPQAVLGAGVNPALATSTRQATIRNTGTNCLTISGITNSAPFSFVVGSSSVPFPATLQPGQELNFDILFAPGALGNFSGDLNINPTPSFGNTFVRCTGQARAPQLTITYNNNINFGNVPLTNTVNRILTITNTGEASITINFPPPPAGSPYQWTPPSGAAAIIAPGSNITIAITFTPVVEGPDNPTITFTSNANGSPHNVSLNGSGCVANSVLNIPNSGPVAMGNIQRGFRTVRQFIIRNNGDGILTFNIEIVATTPGDPASQLNATLFGLVEDTTPVTSPLQALINRSINPVTPCGTISAGSGEYKFGIAFFANAVPDPANARLRIYNHNDITSGISAEVFINLTAVVTNPVSVDVALVLDRSGSMSETSGSRIKIETARDAAKLFVQLSRPDVEDRIALVKFNNVPEIVRSVGFITAANQSAIEADISPANFSPSGSTAIAGGVLLAQNDINSNPRPSVPTALNKVILVLTDGKDNTPYTNPTDGITYSLLGGGGDTPLPVPTDMKIYAIGIGDSVDSGRLGQLAGSSGGAFLQAKEFSGTDYFNLEKHFTQVYMEAVDYSPIADPVFNILPGETHTFEFEVLQGDKSAMIVIYDKDTIRIPFLIISPIGELIDLLSFPAGYQVRPGISPTARFFEINMPQGEPSRYAGTWKVIVKHDKKACLYNPKERDHFNDKNFNSGFQPANCKDNYNNPILYGIAIGVGSNFNMFAFLSPGVVRVGEPLLLTAMIAEFGLPVIGCTVNVKAIRPDGTITNHTLLDDGLNHDDQEDDGTYALNYLHTYQEGTYTFTFTATGYSRDMKPVKRELVRSKYIEGREKLVPADTPGSSKVEKNCCNRLTRYLIVIIILILILVIRSFI